MKNKLTMRFYLVSVFALGLFVVVAFIFRVQLFMSTPIDLQNEEIYVVAPGSSITALNKKLFEKKILNHRSWLAWYARLHNQVSIKAGEYRLRVGMTPLELLSDLNDGRVISYPVTLVEGWTFEQSLALIHQQEKMDKQLLGESPDVIKSALGIEEDSLEGMLFPDTYRYTAATTDVALLKQAYRRLKNTLEEEWQDRAGDLPYKSPYEALIMASIVEKETGVPEERQQIAGVFVRRLEKGMKLQTDPTVIYGLGEKYEGNIQKKHLLQPTPYNTYVIEGLPPTPIALAGREAIRAALQPASGNSLYFVAKGDGSHHFSATLEEHNQAVKQYQLKRRKDYRSSPANN